MANFDIMYLGSEANDAFLFDRGGRCTVLGFVLVVLPGPGWHWSDLAFRGVLGGGHHRGSQEEGQQPVTSICPSVKGSVLH